MQRAEYMRSHELLMLIVHKTAAGRKSGPASKSTIIKVIGTAGLMIYTVVNETYKKHKTGSILWFLAPDPGIRR